MEYDFRRIEKDWQKKWKESNAYKVFNPEPGEGLNKPKYYVLDMFPYPSGAGLHVGHPLGYIASDIYSRYKRLKGFNVLHPMGFDSFGLPAEQYALDTGQHPAETTKKNIETFKKQLDNIGFCYDWSREVQTSDPNYYKWTQWIFLQLFNSFFCNTEKKALPISLLIKKYETKGATPKTGPFIPGKHFTAAQWNGYSKQQQEEILMNRRLAFSKFGEVNWCEALGTVLANDEVVNGVSERGGHPVEKKKMRQWYLRITSYADRLLDGLETVDFSDSMKEMQRNWIGKSEGAEIDFRIKIGESKETVVITKSTNEKGQEIEEHHYTSTDTESGDWLKVYTTRPDTIFGVDFMVLAPEHELVVEITTPAQKEAIDNYLHYVKSRSDRERQAEVKQITGCFTGSYAINPFDGRQIPVWIAEYVLAGYGTGAIMGVPCGDQRDFSFAKHFNIPITNIIGEHYNGEEANPTKEATLQNSGFLNGMLMKDAIGVAINKIEELGIGTKKVNYKMRDAGFSRQRYWGEPFPIVWKDGIAVPLDEKELPLELPHVDSYKPGPEGEGPLANIKEWVLIPNPSPQVEKGAARVPKYSVHTPVQYELAKQMRKEHTEAEGVLWEVIRDSKLGVKFRRQHPIDKYIVDFICLQEKIIVEADGGYHITEEQKFYDAERTKVLNDIGFEVIRFTNEEIIKHPYKIKEKIKARIEQKRAESSNNSPLRLRRGVGGEEKGSGVRETSTMPGYAGSSWYFLRYMDPHNTETFCDRKVSDYWNQVDLYIGGTEHAVGHLLYSRMWTKVLYDLNLIGFDEPYKRLVNQGMIQGSSRFVYRYLNEQNNIDSRPIFISKNILDKLTIDNKGTEETIATKVKELRGWNHTYTAWTQHHVNVEIVDGIELDKEEFKKSREEYKNADFITEEDGKYFCGSEVEKMSKSKYNTVNPDDLVAKYGADTFRMYEMFLGPVEMSKPWDTKGIEGVHRFLKKFWRLFFKETKAPPAEGFGEALIVTDDEPTAAELKLLHNTIKKIEQDTERFSFNTAVSGFMIATNELTDLKCHKRKILEPLLILLAPYAPHIAEELYAQLRTTPLSTEWRGVGGEVYPTFEEKYVKESSKAYPIAINGKTRHEITLPLDITQQQVEETILKDEVVQKWLEGKQPKKIIYVKNKMINVVI